MEETHYEKILVSSGEVPKEVGEYDTDLGKCSFVEYIHAGREKSYWVKEDEENIDFNMATPSYWLKPYSPKEEAVLFAEWIDKNNYVRSKSKYKLWYMRSHGSGSLLNIQSEFTTEELYDKFKEGR